MPILVRNLPRSVAEQELEALFLPYGKVVSCVLVMDQQSGQSKGFGFVEMDSQEAIDNAIAGLNATKLENNKIRVKWSNQDDYQSKTAENTDSPSGDASTDHAAGIAVKNAWDNARPKLAEEPGDYD